MEQRWNGQALAREIGHVKPAAAVGVFDPIQRCRLHIHDARRKVDAADEAHSSAADRRLIIGEECGRARERGGDLIGGSEHAEVTADHGRGIRAGVRIDRDDLSAAVADGDNQRHVDRGGCGLHDALNILRGEKVAECRRLDDGNCLRADATAAGDGGKQQRRAGCGECRPDDRMWPQAHLLRPASMYSFGLNGGA
jgi:hypothetical protein